jgi:hypothetical protein
MTACNCGYCLDLIIALDSVNVSRPLSGLKVQVRIPSSQELPLKMAPTTMGPPFRRGVALRPKILVSFLSNRRSPASCELCALQLVSSVLRALLVGHQGLH